MKIFFAIKALNDMAGGAERVLCIVASQLALRGHEVTIASFDHTDSAPFYDLNPRVKRKFLGTKDPKHKSSIFEIFSRIIALRKLVHEERPDVAIGFMHSIFIPLAFALIGTGVPVIASEHIVPQYYRDKRCEFLALLISGFFVKTITVLSEPVKKLYPAILQRKMVIAPNPVCSFSPATNTEKKKIILNVARLDPQKGQKILIAAFAVLAPKYPEWNVRIIGEGELRPQLEKMIHNLELTDRIAMPGTNSAIQEEYAQAEIFVIPSLFESFGLATAEAMSFGLPAIGYSDCPGTNEIIINDVNGLLIDADDRMGSLVNALEKLMTDENLRHKLGAQGPETIKPYKPESITDIWETLISQSL